MWNNAKLESAEHVQKDRMFHMILNVVITSFNLFPAKARQWIATIANVIEDSYLRALTATSLREKYRVHYLLRYIIAHDVVIAISENAPKRANTSGPIRGISLELSNERGV